MKLDLFKSSLILLSLGLAGCSTAGGGSSATGAGGATPAVTGTIVAQDGMPEFCQNAAAGKYGAPLVDITTDSPVTRNFGFLVEGTVNSGSTNAGFDCRFDSGGAYLGIITQ